MQINLHLKETEPHLLTSAGDATMTMLAVPPPSKLSGVAGPSSICQDLAGP